ncbi:hypothetical protein BBP40_001633 [Aspergillus hancockii]|nr:hypothetical protein BBP40_001633 [Aspergillus hancockii]
MAPLPAGLPVQNRSIIGTEKIVRTLVTHEQNDDRERHSGNPVGLTSGRPAQNNVSLSGDDAHGTVGLTQRESRPHVRPNDGSHLNAVDNRLIECAFRISIHAFPEFTFIHEPTFVSHLYKGTASPLKLCGILALSARFIPELVGAFDNPWDASEKFASYIRQHIMCLIIVSEDLEAKAFQAWPHVWSTLYMRKRAVKLLLTTLPPPISTCMRKCHSSRFSMRVNEVPLPLGEEEFAFGVSHSTQPPFLKLLDPENYEYQLPSPSPDQIKCDRSLL